MKSVIKNFLFVFLIISSGAIYAEEFKTGNLPTEYCSQDDSQNYWYLRTPPYVGYSKGERTNAGSDTCVLGFPKQDSNVGYVLVDKKIIKVFPVTSSKRENIYSSKDKKTKVHLSITGGDTTCSPNSESCCGEYTYATIKIQQNNHILIYKAVMYEGG